MYYTVIKYSSHLGIIEKCRKDSHAARVFYISLDVFSNSRRLFNHSVIHDLGFFISEVIYILCSKLNIINITNTMSLTRLHVCLNFQFYINPQFRQLNIP